MFYPRGGGGFFFPMFMPMRGRGRPMRYGLKSVVVTCNLYKLLFLDCYSLTVCSSLCTCEFMLHVCLSMILAKYFLFCLQAFTF